MILIFSPVEVGQTIEEEFVRFAVSETSTIIFSILVTGTFLKIYNNFKDQCICKEIYQLILYK